jgi:hypothetical protein
LNFGQTVPDKNPGTIGNILGNAFGNSLGTEWEHNENWGTLWGHDRNTLGTRGKKNPSPPAPSKEKNWTIHECMLICFLFFFLVQFLPLQLAEAKYGDQQFWK